MLAGLGLIQASAQPWAAAAAQPQAPAAAPLPGLRVEMLRDPGGQLQVSDLDSPVLDIARRWQALHEPRLALGITRDVVWLRLTLAVPAPGDGARWLVVGQPFLDELRLYPPGAPAAERRGEPLMPWRAGDHVPVSERPTALREAVFPLPAGDGGAAVYHLRVQTRSTMSLRVALWEPEAYARHLAAVQARHGLLLGLMLSSALVSLLAGAWIRQAFFFIAASYLLCFGALHAVLNGYDQILVYPQTPWWADRLVGVFGFGASLLMLAFVLSYLRPGRQHPWLARVMVALGVLSALGVLGSALGLYAALARWLFLISVLLIVVVVLTTAFMLRSDPQRAALMGLMFLPGLLAAGAQTLRNLGALPTSFWTTELWELTIWFKMPFAAVVVLLHLRSEQRRLAEGQRREREQRDFVNLMAHELRTPLAVLGAALTNIKLRSGTLPELQPRFARAETALARLNVLVDNALADSRLADGRLSLHWQPMTPSALVDRLRPMLLVEPPHRLHVEHDDDERPVDIDPQWLGQAVLNLVDNAVKYSPAGGEVRLAVRRTHDRLRVEVSDEGVGVPESERAQLFERFFRAPNTPPGTPGLGLGLFLVGEVARRHGGRAWHEARDGGGSRFVIEVPAAAGPRDAGPEAEVDDGEFAPR